MDEQQQHPSDAPASGNDDAAAFLDTVTGRLAVVFMVALILAGSVAIVKVVRDRNDASANQAPSARLLDRDFAVTGSEVLSITPPVITGACPVETHFTANIQTTGAEGIIRYRWFFDDAGATEPEEVLLPAEVSSIDVELVKPMGGPDGKYSGMTEQVSIQILEQNGEEIPVASRKSSFTIACGT